MKKYIIKLNQIINNLPVFNEWHSENILSKFKNISWNSSIKELHKPENIGNYKSNFIKDLLLMKYFQHFLLILK